MPLAIKINPKDNVVVALHPIAKGTAVPVDGASVTAVEDIPQGHKMAIAPIHAGENVIKYGFPIGHATADAVPGTWMHTHNVKTNLSGEIEYSYHPNVHPLAPVAPETFMGYRRKDGRWEGRYIAMRLPDGRAKYKSVYGFQPTCPVWGRTSGYVIVEHDGEISIHLPRVGQDRLRSDTRRTDHNFNPPAPCGAGPSAF